MEIKRRRIKVDKEKDVLTGVIISDEYIRGMYTLLQENIQFFKSSYIKTVVTWCLEYYSKYEKVPGSAIIDIFTAKSESLPREEDINFIDALLEDISDTFEEEGVEFHYEQKIEEGTAYCKSASLLHHAAEVRGLVETGNIAEAESRIAEYKRVDIGSCNGIDMLDGAELRKKIYSPENSNSVIKFPGPFGDLLGPLEKGGLYLLASNSKKGKSWVALEMAKLCVMAGLTVHYYTLEMQGDKLQERFDMNISTSWKYVKPMGGVDDTFYSGGTPRKRLKTPVFNETNSIDFIEDSFPMLETEHCNRVERLFSRQYSGTLRVYDITDSGNTLDGIIRNEDNEEKYIGSDSAVIIIDSVYLCSDGKGEKEYQRYNDLHRRAKQELGEKRKKVVITPYQQNKDALKTGGDESNLSGSYAVFSHASAALFLSATKEEMERNLMQVNANGRDNNYGGTVICTRQLDLGRGFIDSRWKKDIPDYEAILGMEVSTEADMDELNAMTGPQKLGEV